jgi:hypothetical protein
MTYGVICLLLKQIDIHTLLSEGYDGIRTFELEQCTIVLDLGGDVRNQI